jgi:hypothetical protein
VATRSTLTHTTSSSPMPCPYEPLASVPAAAASSATAIVVDRQARSRAARSCGEVHTQSAALDCRAAMVASSWASLVGGIGSNPAQKKGQGARRVAVLPPRDRRPGGGDRGGPCRSLIGRRPRLPPLRPHLWAALRAWQEASFQREVVPPAQALAAAPHR